MKIKFDFLDNIIEFIDGYINVIETENKKYFTRIINDLLLLNEGTLEEINIFENNNELNITNKINIIIDYFNIDFNNKKYINEINKIIINNIDESIIKQINDIYKQLYKQLNKVIKNIDLPIIIDNNIELNYLLKIIKMSIQSQNDILSKILLLIDIEDILKIDNLLIFINLKQYLTKEELEELYKYSIYKNVKILLIDSQAYGISNKYEKKLLIDENLEEYVL